MRRLVLVKGGVDGFLDRLFKQLIQGSARGQLLDLSFKLLNLLDKLLDLFLFAGHFVVLRLMGNEGWRKVRFLDWAEGSMKVRGRLGLDWADGSNSLGRAKAMETASPLFQKE